MLKLILSDLGHFTWVAVAMAFVTAVVALLFQEWAEAGCFALTGGILAALAAGLGRFDADDCKTQGTAHSLASVAFSWGALAYAGGFPLWLCATWIDTPPLEVFQSPVNCWFEGMSGFTSTGLSMVSDAAQLPRSVQWWRSLMEWVGGVGVIVLGLALLDRDDRAYNLYEGEGRSDRLGSSAAQTAKRLWKLYTALTGLTLIAYLVLGMPWWEAINHAMTTASTGGFSVRSDSFASYSIALQMTAVVATMLAAVSFQVHYLFWVERDWRAVFRDTALRTLVVAFAVGLALMLLIPLWIESELPAAALIFQWASALATAGLDTAELSEWPPVLLLVLIAAMFIGGAAGSTAGGVKVDRVAWVLKSNIARIRSVWHEEDYEARIHFDGEMVETEKAHRRIRAAGTLGALYLLAGSLGLLLLSLIIDAPLSHTLFETISALGGVGLSTGITGAHLPASAKVTMITLMWMGRLEILAVIVMIYSPFRASTKLWT